MLRKCRVGAVRLSFLMAAICHRRKTGMERSGSGRARSSTLIAQPRPRFAIHGIGGSFVKHGLDPQEAQLKSGMSPSDPLFGVDSNAGMLTLADGRRWTRHEERCGRLSGFGSHNDRAARGREVHVLLRSESRPWRLAGVLDRVVVVDAEEDEE